MNVVAFFISLLCLNAFILALTYSAGLELDEPGSSLRLVAGGVYLSGVLFVTITYHVPRNDRLDRVVPESLEGAEDWLTYQREWIPMNHVRSLASLVSASLLVVSLTSGQG